MNCFKYVIEKIKNFFLYEKENLENTYYEESMNEYGSTQDTKYRVKRYVKKLKKRKKINGNTKK